MLDGALVLQRKRPRSSREHDRIALQRQACPARTHVAAPRHGECVSWLADKLDASSDGERRETGMQSKILWYCVRWWQSFWKRNAVYYLQGMVVWLQDHLQFMLDDLVG
jgi:hypothetical protein